MVKIADGAEAYSALTHSFSCIRKRRQTLICRLVLLLPLPDSGHTQESRARSCAACPGMVDTWANDSGHGLQQGFKQMLQISVTSLCRRFATASGNLDEHAFLLVSSRPKESEKLLFSTRRLLCWWPAAGFSTEAKRP